MSFFSGGIGFNFFTLLFAVLSVLLAGFGLYYARQSVFPPKRRLTYYVLPPSALLSDDSASRKGLEVRYLGEELKDPYLVTMSIENTGRHAITSAQFDRERPAVIDLGVPIKAVPKMAVTPGAGSGYEHAVSGSTLRLGPDLLNPGHTLTVQLLTDGHPDVTELDKRSVHHLGDTKIEFKDRQPTVRDQARPAKVWSLIGAVASVAALGASLIALYDTAGISVSLSPEDGPPGAHVVLTGEGAEQFAVIVVDTGDVKFPMSVSASSGPSSAAPTSTPQYAKLELARTQADKSGHFQASFNMSENIGKGAIELTVRVNESGSTAYEYVKFFVR